MRAMLLASLLIISACAASDRRHAVLATCDAYATTLQALATYKAAGRLSVRQIETVDVVRPVMTQGCMHPGDADAALLEAGQEALLKIIKEVL